jgi:hypothetical protein
MTIQLNSVMLDGLVWQDEYTAQSVSQTRSRTLNGGQVVFYSSLTGGREITLESASDTGWLTKTQIEALKGMADSPGEIMSLTIRGTSHQVMFRHDAPPAFEAVPLFPFANPTANDYYLAKIKLVTV